MNAFNSVAGAIAGAAAGGKSRNIGGILGGLGSSTIARFIARRQKNKNQTQNIASQGTFGQHRSKYYSNTK